MVPCSSDVGIPARSQSKGIRILLMYEGAICLPRYMKSKSTDSFVFRSRRRGCWGRRASHSLIAFPTTTLMAFEKAGVPLSKGMVKKQVFSFGRRSPVSTMITSSFGQRIVTLVREVFFTQVMCGMDETRPKKRINIPWIRFEETD